MNGWSLKLLTSLLSLSLFWAGLTPPSWAGDNYQQGMTAYKQKQYQQAAQYMAAAVKENPGDAKRVFYLGLIYAKTGDMKNARTAFEQVVQMVPQNDDLAAKARNNISYITSSQMINIGNAGKASQIVNASMAKGSKANYLTHVLTGGKLVHFDPKRMPLKVYISDGKRVAGWTPQMKALVTHATSAWQKATGGKVRFMITSQPDNADIVVRWQRDFQDNILGVSPFQATGDTIIRSDVTLAMYYPGSSVVIPTSELQGIAIHEFGHAIGMKGHSPYPQDIMYYSRTGQQSLALSSRDISTINLLYKFEADVKNDASMSTAQTKKYYDLFQLGLTAQNAGQTEKAIQYYRQAIQLSATQPEAKFNLGGLLINRGGQSAKASNHLDQAQKDFEEAASLFQSIQASGKTIEGVPKEGVAKNLEIARNNLAVLKSIRARASN